MKKAAFLVAILAVLLVSCGAPKAVVPPAATAIPCAGAPDASAQRLTLGIQTRDGRNVAGGGIIIRPGESASFGPSGETLSAGFWDSIEDGKYTVQFSDSAGKTFALVELQGEVQWDETQCLVTGEKSFIRISTAPDEWMSISKQEVVGGRLILTDERGGQYQVVSFGPQFYGVMAKP